MSPVSSSDEERSEIHMNIGPNRRDQKHSLVRLFLRSVPPITTPDVQATDVGGSWSSSILFRKLIREPPPLRSSTCHSQIGSVYLIGAGVCLPSGPRFECVWWLTGPAATSVEVVGKVACGKDSGDFLRLLLKRRFMVVVGKTRVMDPQHQTR